ncbi:hypothetical protein C6502_16415 [Candidatus Poribacteria bacterium]|nr:MAG: hypothetical protein C6502_16415 [Candidatus Poribacteria bacterium]
MAQNNDLLFSTDDWVEIYRTTDEWESNLIQTMLGNEQIRCRPDYLRNADRQRQIILSVHPDDRVDALEIVSRTGLAITNEEYENRDADDERESLLKRADKASESDLPPTPTAEAATIIAEREGIGKIAHHVGRGYELQVGPTPYYMVEEDRWEEFTDFSAQRQEFSILIRHEYPNLSQWLRREKLFAEFTHLVEATYRDVPPTRSENRQQTESAADNAGAVEVQINGLAKFGLWVSLVALLGVIVQLPWYASIILALLAVVTGCIAKYQIDRSNGTLKGNLIAFLAIIIACIVIAIAWSQRQPSLPESSDLQSAFLPHQADTRYNMQLGGKIWLLVS